MNKTVYLIRHSGPFVDLGNIDNVPFELQSERMILSVDAEKKAQNLSEDIKFNDVDQIYSANSNRAIATIKYIANKNNLMVNVQNEINERKFGINYISDLPQNFIEDQFMDENYKLPKGESLLETRQRMDKFITNLLKDPKSKKIVLSLHGIAIMAYLKKFCNVEFYDRKFKLTFNNKIVCDRKLNNPDVFELEFDLSGNLLKIKAY